MVKYYFYLALSILFTSCFKDDELTLIKQTNISNILNLNGYFIVDYGFGNSEIYFLYRNGLILSIGGTENSKINEYVIDLTTGKLKGRAGNNKFSWGVYEISGSSIKYERWYPSEKPYETGIREGEILNDSTFVIKKSYAAKKPSESRVLNEVYKFRSFSPKPDSTNMFIK